MEGILPIETLTGHELVNDSLYISKPLYEKITSCGCASLSTWYTCFTREPCSFIYLLKLKKLKCYPVDF